MSTDTRALDALAQSIWSTATSIRADAHDPHQTIAHVRALALLWLQAGASYPDWAQRVLAQHDLATAGGNESLAGLVGRARRESAARIVAATAAEVAS